MMKERVTVRIVNANLMTAQQRRDIAEWLDQQGVELLKNWDECERVYIGRYYTEEDSDDRRRAR